MIMFQEAGAATLVDGPWGGSFGGLEGPVYSPVLSLMCSIGWRSQQPEDEEEGAQSPKQRFLGCGKHMVPKVESCQEQSWHLEGASHRVLSKFIPVSCDSVTSSDTRPCKPTDSFEACALGQQSYFLFCSWHVLKSSSKGLPSAATGRQGGLPRREQQACSVLPRALRVSRRMRRWLSLLLRLACSRDAPRKAGEQESRRKWREKNRRPGGGAVLYPPPAVIPGSSFKKSQVPGPLGPGNRWALTGRSESLRETYSRTSPVGKGKGSGRNSIRPVGFRVAVTKR